MHLYCGVLVARRFVVRGRVQGVGFRVFAQDAARLEGLHGWVTNRVDGTVEVHAEGDREAITRFERQLRRGPAGAHIDQIEAHEDVPSGRTSEFTIRS
jgi:acylphosphatase